MLRPLPQDGEDLPARTAVDEDDEAEAELLLVGLVQPAQGREQRGILVGALLLLGGFGPGALPYPRMRVQRLDTRLLGELLEHLPRLAERVVPARELLGQARVALEQRVELLDAQLPR